MYTLILVMITTIGIPSAVTFSGPTPYSTLEECQAQGKLHASWLTQEFVKVVMYCVKSEGGS